MLRLDLRRLVERKRRRMALALFGQLLLRRGAAGILRLVRFPTADVGVDSLGRSHLGRDILRRRIHGLEQGRNVERVVTIQRRVSGSLAPAMSARTARHSPRSLVSRRATRHCDRWLSWDFAMHRLPLRPYFFGGAITILLGTAYLEWFAFRERRIRRDLARLDRIESAGSD